MAPGGELVTLLLGVDAEPGLADDITAYLADEHRHVEVTVYDGGQRHYPVLIGVE